MELTNGVGAAAAGVTVWERLTPLCTSALSELDTFLASAPNEDCTGSAAGGKEDALAEEVVGRRAEVARGASEGVEKGLRDGSESG